MAAGSGYQVYRNSKKAWEAMYQAILGAQKSIYWELYIFLDDDVGNPFFDILEAKAKQGVDVKLIVDSIGSFWLSRKRVQSLKKNGVDIRFFFEREHRYKGLWKALVARSHRKILIIDGNVGFIGGVNISQRMRDWQDIHLGMHGQVVHSLLRSFAKSYIICGGEREKVRHLLKYKFRAKNNKVDFVFADSHDRKSLIRNRYTEALLRARERVIFFSPYYFPDKKFLYALWKARKRGVKIDLLIPFRSDIRLAQYSAFACFNILQKLGVTIHLSKKMMHGKGMIVDDDMAMVGSSNLDQTSFYDNYEADVGLTDKRLVLKLKRTISQWIKAARKLEDIDWEKRGKLHKLKEKLAWHMFRIWHGKDKL